MNDGSPYQIEESVSGEGTRRPGLPFDPYRVRRALWHGRKLLIASSVIGVVVGYAWAKLMISSEYVTTAVLRYEGEMQVGDLPPARFALVPLADALGHQSVLEKIAEEIEFDGSLTAVESSLHYAAHPPSGTVEITVGGETGEEAASFVRVVTDVFMTYHRERQARRIEAEIERGKRRIDAAEDELAVARRRYDEFRDKHGIANLSVEQQSTVSSAATLRANSELAGLEIRAVEAEIKTLNAELENIPKTSFVSGGSSPERDAYNAIRLELATARATLSPDHPRVRALEHQEAQLRMQIRSGGGLRSIGAGTVGVNTSYQVVQGQLREANARLVALRERQKSLSEMADKAQNRMEGFSDIEGDAYALLHEVKVNENVLNRLRRSEAGLEDALSDPPSGFVVLDPGAVPEYPEQNKMKLVFFGGFSVLGVLVGLLLVLRQEFRGLYVETPTEVAFWGNGPVLGATTWPADAPGLDELVAGLDDFIPRAKGSLLVVGASDDESRRSQELASRLKNDWFLEQKPSAPRPVGGVSTRPPGAPLTTPPPSGPYPVGHTTGSTSTALARIPSPSPDRLAPRDSPMRLELQAWDGPREGRTLRRAARLADRVLVVVRSGSTPVTQLFGTQKRLGRDHGIGYIVIGLPEELHGLPDRVGNVAHFWQA